MSTKGKQAHDKCTQRPPHSRAAAFGHIPGRMRLAKRLRQTPGTKSAAPSTACRLSAASQPVAGGSQVCSQQRFAVCTRKLADAPTGAADHRRFCEETGTNAAEPSSGERLH